MSSPEGSIPVPAETNAEGGNKNPIFAEERIRLMFQLGNNVLNAVKVAVWIAVSAIPIKVALDALGDLTEAKVEYSRIVIINIIVSILLSIALAASLIQSKLRERKLKRLRQRTIAQESEIAELKRKLTEATRKLTEATK